MDLTIFASMPKENIEAFKERVRQEIGELAQWRAFAESGYGIAFLRDRKETRDVIRSLYRAIDVAKDGAVVQFARLQGYEECLDQVIQKLENLDSAKERLDKDLADLSLLIERKIEGRPDPGSSIVSDQIRSEHNGGRE